MKISDVYMKLNNSQINKYLHFIYMTMHQLLYKFPDRFKFNQNNRMNRSFIWKIQRWGGVCGKEFYVHYKLKKFENNYVFYCRTNPFITHWITSSDVPFTLDTNNVDEFESNLEKLIETYYIPETIRCLKYGGIPYEYHMDVDDDWRYFT